MDTSTISNKDDSSPAAPTPSGGTASPIQLNSNLLDKGAAESPRKDQQSKFNSLSKTSLLLFTTIFISACAMYFTHLGDMPLFNPDEALYAEPAREMLETGEYVTTYLNYQVRYTKPPLFIWAIAASMKAFAVSEFASRFFSAACGAILVGLTYLFTEKFIGRKQAILAAFLLLLSPMYLAISRLAITDIPLSLFVSGSAMGLIYGFYTKENRWKWLSYGLIGLGVMTKGPVAIVLPALMLVPYHLIMGEVKKAWSYYRPLAGLGVIALIALPWFALETWVTRGEYFESFIMRENLQRFTGVVDHKYPWWYHLAAMGGGFFPFTLALPFAWFLAIKKLIPATANPKEFIKAPFENARNQNLSQKAFLFSALASLSILIFFSSSVSKLLPYTLPAFPFLAITTAYLLTAMAKDRKWLPVTIGYAIFSTAILASYSLLPYLEAKLRYCPPELISYLPGYITFLAITGIVPLALSISRKIYASYMVFLVMLASGILYFGPPLQNIFADAWERPLQSFVQYAAQSDKPIYLCNIRKPSATFYALRRVEKEESLEGLFNRFSTVDSAYVIGRASHKEIYLKSSDFKLVAESGRFIMLEFNNKERAKIQQNSKRGVAVHGSGSRYWEANEE